MDSKYTDKTAAPRIHGRVTNKSETKELVEKSLVRAGLWKEVKDQLTQDYITGRFG